MHKHLVHSNVIQVMSFRITLKFLFDFVFSEIAIKVSFVIFLTVSFREKFVEAHAELYDLP